MQYEITVGGIGWIDMSGPWPFQQGDSFGALAEQGEAGLNSSPSWISKTYMGLMATSNRKPPSRGLDFPTYKNSGDFRGMLWARLAFSDGAVAGQTGPVGATLVGQGTNGLILDPGVTPPVDVHKVGAMGKLPFWMRGQIAHVRDRTPHPAELSPVSAISTTQLQPSSSLGPVPAGERLIASGMIKFRAGPITDAIGKSDAGSQFHVPWVWVEFLLTYLGLGRVRLRGASSIFPTTAFYLNGDQVAAPNPQQTDADFPDDTDITESGFMIINQTAMRIWPVLSAGAPIAMAEPPKEADAQYVKTPTLITRQQWTCPGKTWLDVTGRAVPRGGAGT